MVPSVADRGALEPGGLVRSGEVLWPAPCQLDVHRLLAVRQHHRVRLEIWMAGSIEPQAFLPVLRWQLIARVLFPREHVVLRQAPCYRLDLGRLGADLRGVKTLLRRRLRAAGQATHVPRA